MNKYIIGRLIVVQHSVDPMLYTPPLYHYS